MKTFEFWNELPFKIAGHEFVLTIDEDYKRLMDEHDKKFNELAKSPEAKNMTEQEVMPLCEEVIDKTFGDGAYAKIFAQRKASVRDVMDILFYVKSEIRALAKRNLNRGKKKKASNKSKR